MTDTTKLRGLAAAGFLTGVLALSFAAAAPALAQDGGGPDPEEIRRRIVEVDRLMKEAEQSLARSLDTSSAKERARRAAELLDQKAQEATGTSAEELRREAAAGSDEARRTLERIMREAEEEAGLAGEEIRKLLEEKAQESAGKSAEELRRMAAEGSKEAGETLRRLLEEAAGEAEQAGGQINKLLEETGKSGRQITEGLEWLLEKAQSGGGHGPPKQKEDKPEDGEDKPEDPKDDPDESKPPEPEPEQPRSPEFEKWITNLPDKVRQAYESEDWDSIPPKWRDILQRWTKKMADELERKRSDPGGE